MTEKPVPEEVELLPPSKTTKLKREKRPVREVSKQEKFLIAGQLVLQGLAKVFTPILVVVAFVMVVLFGTLVKQIIWAISREN